MPLLIGFLLVLLAALLQGTFVLPMTLVRNGHGSTLGHVLTAGMFVFNWIITFLLVPKHFRRVFRVSCERPRCAGPFWAGWGVGAVLFGLGMERLGMAWDIQSSWDLSPAWAR